MSADTLSERLPDTRPLHRLISRTRRLLRSSWVVTGAGLSLGLLLGALVLLAGLDLVAPLPPYTWTIFHRVIPIDGILRLIALLLVVVPASWAFLVGVVRPLFRRLASVHVARRIEQHLPGIHNRLVSCIDLEAKDRPPVSPVFHRRLLTEALARISGFRPSRVLDALSLRRAAIFAFVATLTFGLIWAVAANRLPRALARLFHPFADLPPISQVAYDVEPGEADVLRKEPIFFAAHITTASDPQDMRLELYNDEGRPALKFDLKADKLDPKLWHCTVDGRSLGDGYQDGFRYRIFGGDTWSTEYRVRLVERPVIIGKEVAVYYPAYMALPEPHPIAPQAKVIGPEDSEVEVAVTAQGVVASGEIQLVAPGVKHIPPHQQTERVWFEGNLPYGTTAEGTWNWTSLKNRPVHTEPQAVGTHSHWFQGDPAGLEVAREDMLFAYVWIDPEQRPETILLQWHDGESWDHGAYWGADRIKEGKADSPARRSMGQLPPAGQWVRLTVPAKSVGLEGKKLRGMAFKLHQGVCLWGGAGSVQTQKTVEDARIVGRFPLQQAEDGRWVGRFPLMGKGRFRPELKNAQGHPNIPEESKEYEAQKDMPPYKVEVLRNSSEIELSKAAAEPLAVRAADDYGLKDVTLLVRESEAGEYKPRILQEFAKPECTATVVGQISEAANLKPGGQLWFKVRATDRKGQSTETREYVIRLSANPNAADRQREEFEKTQDTFRERLIQLIAEQKKVKEQIDKLTKEYVPVAEKVQAALDEARAKQEADPKKPQTPPPPKLDPETARKFAELQRELAKLSQQEQQNATIAQQIANDLARAMDEANKRDVLPEPLAKEMEATQQQFQKMVADAMRNLSQEMQQGAQPNPQNAPNLEGMEQKGERVQKELEETKARLDALANARKDAREDLKRALEQLQREMLAMQGKMTDKELQELKDFLAKLREQMKDLQAKQEALEKATENGLDLAEARKRQEDLDKQMEELLARARKLLEARRDRKKDDKPDFPDRPYDPDRDEVKVPPREEDSNEPLPRKGDKSKPGEKGDKKDEKKDMDDDDKEPLYMPALGGPREKVDPRFAKKRRPVKKDPTKGDKEDPDQERNNLEDRQNSNERNLDAAQKSLESDQRSLEDILRQLERSLSQQSKGKPSSPSEQSQAEQMADQLRQMMESQAMQQARAMADRMRQGRQMGRPQRGQRQPNPSHISMPHALAPEAPGSKEVDLSKFDPETRALILKLPPSRQRDELIQGLSEEGPQAYREFIKDYFRRLSETKNPGK
jgi:hypothetical protein